MGVCGDDDDDDDVFRMSRVCVGDSAGQAGNLSWASKSRERPEELSQIVKRPILNELWSIFYRNVQP